MAKKQFKIGECAVGGIIAVECTDGKVSVHALDYNTKQPVLMKLSLSVNNTDDLHSIECYLWEITTSYHADKIIDWIKTAIKL
jgi:hypothetical protein